MHAMSVMLLSVAGDVAAIALTTERLNINETTTTTETSTTESSTSSMTVQVSFLRLILIHTQQQICTCK